MKRTELHRIPATELEWAVGIVLVFNHELKNVYGIRIKKRDKRSMAEKPGAEIYMYFKKDE